MRGALKVIGVAVLILILTSTFQWVEYEKAYGVAEALPCNGTLAPYRAEVTSFLPPWDLLQKALGQRKRRGEIEILVPEGVRGSKKSLEYDILLDIASHRLSSDAKDLRSMLTGGNSTEHVKDMFFWVKVDYFVMKFAGDYGKKNLTEVVIKPSPPLGWLIEVKDALSVLNEPVKNVLFAFLLSLGIFSLALLWFYILGRVFQRFGVKSSVLKGVLAVVTLLLISFPAARVVLWLGGNADRSETWGGENFCGWVDIPEGRLWNMAVDYVYSHENTSSCEVLGYLRGHLTRGEFETLQRAVRVECPQLIQREG